MSFTYGIGLQRIVPADAPCWNCNAVEDLVNLIQVQLDEPEWLARELFPAGSQTLTGSSQSPFACIWADVDVAGLDRRVPAGLLALAPGVFEEFGSVPSAFDFPGSPADILVPNWPPAGEDEDPSPRRTMLKCAQPLTGAEKILGRPTTIGSLLATLGVLEEQRGSASPEEQEIIDEMLRPMRVARRYDLFFSFRF